MVCATPTFRALREAYPEAEIALVCAPVNHDVVRHSPHLDHVLLFDKRACTRLGPLVEFIGRMRKFDAELAFVLNSVSYSVTSAALAAVSGARWIVGCDSDPFGFDISRHAYSLVMPSFPVMDRHAIDHHLAPLEAVGLGTRDRTTLVVPSVAELERAAEIATTIPGTGDLWIMHPGAAKTANLWPTDRFAEIAKRLVAAGRRVLVLQGPADAEVMIRFRSAMEQLQPEGPGAWRELPTVTVGVCAALLKRADRFLCNDTGLMHVAGAVGAPTLALFGPTDPAHWAPRTRNLHVLRGEDRTPGSLDVELVWRAWNALETTSEMEA